MNKPVLQEKIKFSALGEYLRPRVSLSKIKRMYGLPVNNVSKDVKVAMDSRLDECGHFSAIERVVTGGGIDTLPQFLGYAYLSGLQQNGFIRAGVEGLADDMTESWVELMRSGEAETDADGHKVSALNAIISAYGVKDIFNKAAALCGYFGGCLIFIDDGTDDADLASAMDTDGLEIKNLTVIEPINVYPGRYNSANPLRADYFKPKTWFILGREVHISRLLYFSFNDLGVLLRPAYNFFGVSAAQIAVDSVAHFIKDKEAASRLLHKFSLLIFKTDMGSALYGGNPEELYRRIKLLADFRDNDSVEVLDKEEEDISQLTTTIGGVTDIVRQSLELMPIMFRQPLTKFLGISPGGMNATGESDENNWNAYVLSQCEKLFREPLKKLLELFQHQLWGKVDKDISFVFKKRSSRDIGAKVNNNKVKADIDAVYLTSGVLSAEEVRKRIAEDPDSGYNSIDADFVPEPSEQGNEDYFTGGANDWDPFEFDDDYNPAFDKDFDERNVKRADNGQFSSGGGYRKPQNAKNFGKAFKEYSGKPKEAIEKLLNEKKGYVPAALHRGELGNIDIVWGEPGKDGTNEGYGFAHILRRREEYGIDGEGLIKRIPEIISKGKVEPDPRHETRKRITYNDERIIVETLNGEEKNNWILTEFIRGNKKRKA